jgi:hypothetical protein
MIGNNEAPVPIIVIDQFLHPQVFSRVAAQMTTLTGWKREVDFVGAEPIGETADLPAASEICGAIAAELGKLFHKTWKLDRFYVNRFRAGEVPRFHQDGEVVTCLLYADAEPWQPDDHGETQLLVGGEIRGVLPIANRMLLFDGRLLHRATAFRSRVRHTIATKIEGVGLSDVVLPGS